jgi:hypothetical protein
MERKCKNCDFYVTFVEHRVCARVPLVINQEPADGGISAKLPIRKQAVYLHPGPEYGCTWWKEKR